MTDDADQNYCLFCGEPITDVDTTQLYFIESGTVDCESCGTVYDLTVRLHPT